MVSSGVEATLTQHVSLQITDRTLTQLSIHCPKLQALVSQHLVLDLPLRDERCPATLPHYRRNLLSGRVSSIILGFRGLLVGLTWEVENLRVTVFVFGCEPNTGTQVLTQIHGQPVRVKRSCISVEGGLVSIPKGPE